MKYGDSSNSNRIDLFDQKDGALDMLRFKETQEEDDCYEIMDGEVDFDLGKQDTVYVAYCTNNNTEIVEAEFNLQNEGQLLAFNELCLNKTATVLIVTRSLEMYNIIKDSGAFTDDLVCLKQDKLYFVVCQADNSATIRRPSEYQPNTIIVSPSYGSISIDDLRQKTILLHNNKKWIPGSNFYSNDLDIIITAIANSKRYTCKELGTLEAREVSLLCFDGFMCEDQINTEWACRAIGGSYCKDGECVPVNELSCETGAIINVGVNTGTIEVFYDNKNCDNKPCATQTPTPESSEPVPSESAP